MRWTQQQYNDYIARKLPRADLDSVENPQRQPNQRSQSQDRVVESSEKRLGYRVGIISVRSRKIDEHDNLRQGCKPLVDAITASLGFSRDDDPRIVWEYGSVIGKPEGTIVRIHEIKL